MPPSDLETSRKEGASLAISLAFAAACAARFFMVAAASWNMELRSFIWLVWTVEVLLSRVWS